MINSARTDYKLIRIIEAATLDQTKTSLPLQSQVTDNLTAMVLNQTQLKDQGARDYSKDTTSHSNDSKHRDGSDIETTKPGKRTKYEQKYSPLVDILILFILSPFVMLLSAQDSFDATFYVDEYGKPITWKTRIKAFLEWPSGKGKAEFFEYFEHIVLFRFVFCFLKNTLKFALEFPLCFTITYMATYAHLIRDTMNKAYPNGIPMLSKMFVFCTSGFLEVLGVILLLPYMAVGAILSPIACYEIAKNWGGPWLGRASIAFSVTAIAVSLILLGPLALFIAGKIASPMAIKTLAVYLAQLATHLGITPLVLSIAKTLGVGVATVTAGIFTTAISLVVAIVVKLPTIFTYILTRCGFFAGSATNSLNPHNKPSATEERPSSNDPNVFTCCGITPKSKEDLNSKNNSAYNDLPTNKGSINSDAAGINKFGYRAGSGSGGNTTKHDGHNTNKHPGYVPSNSY